MALRYLKLVMLVTRPKSNRLDLLGLAAIGNKALNVAVAM
jgi:hypothetical protein